jgi:hypothetical protein
MWKRGYRKNSREIMMTIAERARRSGYLGARSLFSAASSDITS